MYVAIHRKPNFAPGRTLVVSTGSSGSKECDTMFTWMVQCFPLPTTQSEPSRRLRRPRTQLCHFYGILIQPSKQCLSKQLGGLRPSPTSDRDSAEIHAHCCPVRPDGCCREATFTLFLSPREQVHLNSPSLIA